MKAQLGDKVRIHYVGRFRDGTVFESTERQEPVQLTLGAEEIHPAFDRAISDTDVGQKLTVEIPMKQAFGPHRQELVFSLPLDGISVDRSPSPGEPLTIVDRDGEEREATVVLLDKEVVVVDANHPLAGQDLIFNVVVTEIVA